MPYQIDIMEKRILVITFFGESNLGENKRAREEVVRINSEAGIFKIVADWSTASISKDVKPQDFADFGKNWPKPVNTSSFVVAVLLSRTNRMPHFGIDFSNEIAKKEGLISRMFWDIEEAFEWLEI